MNPATTLRKLGKLEYTAARLPLSLLDAWVARHWHEDTAARVGFDRYLGTLDLLAGRLLADDAIRQRGRILWGSAGSDVWAQATADVAVAGEPAAGPAGGGPAAWASASGPAAGTAGGGPATGLLASDPAAGPAAGAPAGPAAGAPGGPAAGAPGGPAAGAPAGPAALSPVVVIFTLSAAVQAESVALCGDFNDWSADATPLELGSDGYWRVAVALQPGRSYRYRYLINGELWENARDADAYVPNPYGGTDSVVVVE
jgi:hypothetical protein